MDLYVLIVPNGTTTSNADFSWRNYDIVRTGDGIVLKSRYNEPTLSEITFLLDAYLAARTTLTLAEFFAGTGFDNLYTTDTRTVDVTNFDEEIEETIEAPSIWDMPADVPRDSCVAAHDHDDDQFTITVGSEGMIEIIDVDTSDSLIVDSEEQAQALLSKLSWAIGALTSLDDKAPF